VQGVFKAAKRPLGRKNTEEIGRKRQKSEKIRPRQAAFFSNEICGRREIDKKIRPRQTDSFTGRAAAEYSARKNGREKQLREEGYFCKKSGAEAE